jgi:hypothetical protein
MIGMAKECHDMRDLRDKVARHYGRQVVQFSFALPAPKDEAALLDQSDVAGLQLETACYLMGWHV